MKRILTTITLIATATALWAAPEKQKTCPVSGDSIGGDMGPPITYSDGNRTILFCCKSCVKKYKANPQKYASAVSKALAGS